MNPEWLRYYLAAKLNSRVEDIDFNGDDFIARVNADLIGKYINIASRAANFISKHFDGKLAYLGNEAALSAEITMHSLSKLQQTLRRANMRVPFVRLWPKPTKSTRPLTKHSLG